MEVLLQEDVEKLGKRGDVVKVASGYARNYLMPQGLATKATEENRRMLERQRLAEARRKQEEVQALKNLAQKIEATSCTVVAAASPEGHLFGSVNVEQIAGAFKADGLPVEPEMIKLDSPIKSIGVFTVSVQVTPEHKAVTRVWVVAE
jgi:large subunit ribosomal protein L9